VSARKATGLDAPLSRVRHLQAELPYLNLATKALALALDSRRWKSQLENRATSRPVDQLSATQLGVYDLPREFDATTRQRKRRPKILSQLVSAGLGRSLVSTRPSVAKSGSIAGTGFGKLPTSRSVNDS
jgi:hypothetical protein